MDPQAQMMAAALMGGQNSAMPSQIQQQPDPSQFSPQMNGYGQQQPGQQQNGAGMFSMPYGAQASQNMYPPNMMM